LNHVRNKAALDSVTRRVGKGRTILLSGLMPDVTSIARIVASQLPDALDGRVDDRFATRAEDGILWFDAKTREGISERTFNSLQRA
jgi:hypothetical protein